MPGRYLLDTSIVVSLLRGDQAIQERLAVEESIYLSTNALGELYYGAEKANRPQLERGKIAAISQQCVLLSCDAATAPIYGQFKNQLRQRGGRSQRTTSGSPPRPTVTA